MDKKHSRILRYVYKHPYVSYVVLQSKFAKFLDLEKIVTELERDKMISFRIAESPKLDQGYEHSYVEIDSHLLCLSSGNEYIESITRNDTRWRITTGIAVFAAIGAYRGELVYTLQAIANILK